MSEVITREDALAHFGVKGMKWGVRRASPLTRDARRDVRTLKNAERRTGTGSGTARKKIKTSIEEKKQKVPGYEKESAKALDRHKKLESAGRKAKTALIVAYGAYLYTSLGSSPRTSAGRSYIRSNPGMMNAAARGGVYKVTSMR